MLFGPKVAGIIDVKILLVPLVYFVKFKVVKPLVIPLLLLVMLGFIVGLIEGSVMFQSNIRLVRVILAVLIAEPLVRIFRVTDKDILRVLYLHVAAIFLMMNSASWYAFFKEWVGFTKGYKIYRYFGLVNGYDLAGLLAIIVMQLSYYLHFRLGRVLALVGSFFTSRVTIILGILIGSWSFFKSLSAVFRVLLIIVLTITVLYNRMLLVEFYSSYSYVIGIGDGADSLGGYAVYSLSELFSSIFYWPSSVFTWLFGGSEIRVDSGYSMLILQYGFVGACLTLMFYLRLWRQSASHRIVGFILLLVLLLSLKNEYLFTRSITELLLLFSFVRYNENRIPA